MLSPKYILFITLPPHKGGNTWLALKPPPHFQFTVSASHLHLKMWALSLCSCCPPFLLKVTLVMAPCHNNRNLTNTAPLITIRQLTCFLREALGYVHITIASSVLLCQSKPSSPTHTRISFFISHGVGSMVKTSLIFHFPKIFIISSLLFLLYFSRVASVRSEQKVRDF